MPKKFDRNEQHFLRHANVRHGADDGWERLSENCFFVAAEKILSSAVEMDENPMMLSDNQLRPILDAAFRAVMIYLTEYVRNPQDGPDPMDVIDMMSSQDTAAKFIVDTISKALEYTGEVIDRDDYDATQTLLEQLQGAIAQYHVEAEPQPDAQGVDVLPQQDAMDTPALPVRNLPPEMTEQIPGWGHPPLCDCPSCRDDIDPDDPRLPGFQRLNKTAGDDVRAVYIKFQPQDHHQQVRQDDGAGDMEDSCPWIYWPEDNAVLFGPPNSYHYEMLQSDKELRDKLLGGDNDQALPVWQKFLQSGELLSGRVTWPPNSHATQPRSDQEVFFYGSPSPEEVDLVNRALETDQPPEDEDFKFN